MPEEIVEVGDDDWQAGELTGQQKNVRNLAYIVFGLIAAISVFIVWDWVSRAPARPDFASTSTADVQKTLLENYRASAAIATERAKDMFDLMIVKALLPVFATIVGVILGRRTDGASS